ncbi:MAG: hypothetical protein PHP82_02195 [Candidatus ainarchaeum sp.]|nr:hypothetical protein [Candidatus ainarchaeum sp.]
MAEKNTSSRRKTVDKWKKKKWFLIKASKLFDSKILAETPAEKPINLIGRTLRITLDRLTGQRTKRDTIIYFKTSDVQGQNINTIVSKFERSKSSLGRLIRRGNSKVMVAEKIPVIGGDARITLVTITVRKATNEQKKGINKLMKNKLLEFKGKDFEDVIKELIMGKMTSVVARDAEKICMIKKVIAFKATFTESK